MYIYQHSIFALFCQRRGALRTALQRLMGCVRDRHTATRSDWCKASCRLWTRARVSLAALSETARVCAHRSCLLLVSCVSTW